jgi:pyrroline-5-carboxylate reductase
LRDALTARAAAGGTRSEVAPMSESPTPAMPAADRDAEMIAYYEARAGEYDDWYLRRGRYARGPIHDAAWDAELDGAGTWLDGLPIQGEIVELAGGTGWWSPLLASKGELSIYDAAEAPLERARERLVAHRLRAHLHVRDAWTEPDRRVDALFFGFWLSHVPRDRTDAFLALARRWLKPDGIVAFIDSLPDPQSGADDNDPPERARGGAPPGRFPDSQGYDDRPVLRARRSARLTGPSGAATAPCDTPTMVPLANRTIATVGSGVMAEAMIAGLLRGELVEASQVVASHPRAERRDHLEREYGIRVVSDNVAAIDGADVVLFAIKPQMLGRVGREIGPHLRRGQLVLSVIAGATTAALTGTLGHDQVIRAMPNTPARLGKGMTVWYPTPETTPEQREQASLLLGALGKELEVDDEKFVAMATAVSGTGPTYVFLVMEALIDAAVHLGFPRHVAHDLVIETLEGSTLFAKQSGMHPAELRNMVTSPGGTSAAALHELESGRLRTVLSEAVWAAFRRTVELGDQLEASVSEPAAGRSGERIVAR